MKNETVQLFVTCLIDTLYPEIGEAVVQVLNRAGVRVEFPPDQTCCGQPAFNAGLWPEARAMAEHTLDVLAAAPGPIVVPSGSCAAMLKHHYLELFSEDQSRLAQARDLAGRVYELTEFLVDYLGITDLGARFDGLLTYQASCHLLRHLGIDRQPRALLSAVKGAQLVELAGADECCGFGGVFSVEHPELSTAIVDRKIAALEASGAEWAVTCDAGCLTHINGRLTRQGKEPRVKHIAEILARF